MNRLAHPLGRGPGQVSTNQKEGVLHAKICRTAYLATGASPKAVLSQVARDSEGGSGRAFMSSASNETILQLSAAMNSASMP